MAKISSHLAWPGRDAQAFCCTGASLSLFRVGEGPEGTASQQCLHASEAGCGPTAACLCYGIHPPDGE